MRFITRYDTLACIALAALVTGLFWSHLVGHHTFPWDFQGPYFTHAVARMRDGSFLAPPLWLPWGGFGIPGHLSPQDGTWYLPQYIFDFLGIPYSLKGATRLQVMHVIAAAIGMFTLVRVVGLARMAALLAGAGYVFASSFYSNAQHVDIVRGAALLPWLLTAVLCLLARASPCRFLACVLVTWQFLVGSYPGIVVAAAYAAMIAVAVVVAEERSRAQLGRLALLALAGIVAAGLSAVKFLPIAMDMANIRQSGGDVSLVNAALASTLVSGFDVPALPHDVTMRDLFTPLPLLLLAFFADFRTRAGRIGVVLMALCALVLLDWPPLQSVVAGLPGLRISRFQLSDFRPVLHIAVALLAAAGLDSLLRRSDQHRLVRAAIAAAAVVALVALAARVGNPVSRPGLVGFSLLATLAAAFVLAYANMGEAARRGVAVAPVLLVVLGGAMHVNAAARVWVTPRADDIERARLGDTIENLVAKNRFAALTHRPARIVVNELPVEARGALYDPRYDIGWLGEGFSAFGYEDLKGSAVFQRLYAAVMGDAMAEDAMYVRWMLRPSSVAVGPDAAAAIAAVRLGCATDCPETLTAPGVVMRAFREDGANYDLDLPRASALVENEPWYPGWHSILCDTHACRAGPDSVAAAGLLRLWQVPPGRWRMVTYYRPPGWTTATAVSRGSAVLGLLTLLGLLLWRRRDSVKHP